MDRVTSKTTQITRLVDAVLGQNDIADSKATGCLNTGEAGHLEEQ
jgi:hypothetical protein